MKLNEVLGVLEEHGHSLTRASLYRAGRKNGFLERHPYGNTMRYEIDEEKFNEWLTKATLEVPEGMMTFSQVAKKLNVSYGMIESLVKTGELKCFNYGAGKGVRYVRLRDAEVIVQIHRQNN